MKKLWLSVAVGAVAALALQAGSTQLADPVTPVDPRIIEGTASHGVDPWSGVPVA